MNMNRLTEKAQEAIVSAQRLAEEQRNTRLEPEHLLKALVSQEGGVVPSVLMKMGVQPNQVLQRVDSAISGFAKSTSGGQIYLSQRFRRVYDAAQSEAERLKVSPRFRDVTAEKLGERIGIVGAESLRKS